MTCFCSAVHTPALLHARYHKTATENKKEQSILQARAATICTSWKNPIPDNDSETTKAVTHEGRKSTVCEPFLHVCLEKNKETCLCI